MKPQPLLQGAGLGLRSEFLNELREILPAPVDFLEVTPENWMFMGGSRGKKFAFYADHYTLVAHGLSLSLGSPAPLDDDLLDDLSLFLEKFNIQHYSEHLSYCSDHHGHLYHSLPIPFTLQAAEYVAERISRVQDKLGRQISIENITYYCSPGQTLREIDFILEILRQADCQLLLDVTSVYVNSHNHGYDPREFIREIPTTRIAYCHIAGHEPIHDNLIVNHQGTQIPQNIWDLLQFTYEVHGVLPTVLERNLNVPPLPLLIAETQQIKTLQTATRRPAYA